MQSLRIGFQLFAALVARLMPIQTIFEIYPIFAFIGEMFFLVSIVYFLNKVLQASLKVTLTTLLLIGLAVSLNYKIILLGFMPQLYGISLYILSLTQLITILKNKANNRIIRNYFSYFLLIPALMITYQEIFPFYLLTLAFLLIYFLLIKKINTVKESIIKGAILVSPLVVFYPITLITISGLSKQFTAIVGWNEKINILDFTAIIFGQDTYRITQNFWKNLITLPGRVIAMLIAFFGIYNLKQREENNLLIIFFFPFLIALIYFNFFTINPFDNSTGNSWSIYKLIQWSYWIICITIAFGLEKIKLKKHVIFLLLIFLLPSYIINLKNLFINSPMTINRENKTNNLIGDYKKISYSNFQYKPANVYSLNTHFMNPYCLLVALNDTSRGVFLPLDNSQLFIREIQNVVPRKNHYHWIHYQTYSIVNKSPVYNILGYKIYSPNASFIYSKSPLLADIRYKQIIYTNIYSDNIWLKGNLLTKLDGTIKITNQRTKKSQIYELENKNLKFELSKGFNEILVRFYPSPHDNISKPITIHNLGLVYN